MIIFIDIIVSIPLFGGLPLAISIIFGQSNIATARLLKVRENI